MSASRDVFDPMVWLPTVDIFADLDVDEIRALSADMSHGVYGAGELIHSPHRPVEALFILKQGRVRAFRVATDGRILTTTIIHPGTVFGEVALAGQRLEDRYVEAIDRVEVCIMSRADMEERLLGDRRVAVRLFNTLGRRLVELEQRLSDAVFKSAAERIAGALTMLAAAGSEPRLTRLSVDVHVTHEQLAALVGVSRETTTKVLGDLAEEGLIQLARRRITLVRPQDLADRWRSSAP